MSVADRHDHLINIVMVGNLGSGKSCIFFKYIDGIYRPSTTIIPQVDYKFKEISFGDKKVRLSIYDTCGLHHLHDITELYVRDTDITIIVYDVFDRYDFDVAINWLELIQTKYKTKYKNGGVILVGAQIDRKSNSLREISFTEGSNIGTKYNVFFCECSAKNDVNINTIFDEAIAIYLRKKDTEALSIAESSQYTKRQKELVKNSKIASFFTKLQKIMHL